MRWSCDGVVAGSLAVFSLTMGDYSIPTLVGGPGDQVIGRNRLRLGLSPEINAAATVITAVSLVGIVTSTVLLGRTFWSGGPGNE